MKDKLLLIKTNNKKMTMRVELDTVIVRMPNWATMEDVENYLDLKSKWIKKKLTKELKLPKFEKKRFINGEKFNFLGDEYLLEVFQDEDDVVKLKQNRLTVIKYQSNTKDLLENWFKKQAKKVFESRVMHNSKTIGVKPPIVLIKEYKSMWAQYRKSKHEITFDWRVIQAPRKVINYLVIHELCHIIEPNHQKNFWILLKIHFKELELYRNWLDKNTHKLFWEKPNYKNN